MEVDLRGVGKRFNREWILKDLDLNVSSGEHLAILGGNGSGKSTLLKIISGYLGYSKGEIKYQHTTGEVKVEELFRHVAFVAPYQDIYRQLTLTELCDLHFSLRAIRDGQELSQLLEMLKLPEDVPLSTFSSGMLQRVKLGIAFFTESSLLLLDEPTMNLDEHATGWFIQELKALPPTVTVLIASNLPSEETSTCQRKLRIVDGRLIPSA